MAGLRKPLVHNHSLQIVHRVIIEFKITKRELKPFINFLPVLVDILESLEHKSQVLWVLLDYVFLLSHDLFIAVLTEVHVFLI